MTPEQIAAMVATLRGCADTIPARWPNKAADLILDQAAEIARLTVEHDELLHTMDKDVASILKGRPVIQPAHIFSGPDETAYWKLRVDLSEASAIRSIKMCEHYRQKSVSTQRKADISADQASIREFNLRAALAPFAAMGVK